MDAGLTRHGLFLFGFVAMLALADALYGLWAELNERRQARGARRAQALLQTGTPPRQAAALLQEARDSTQPYLERQLRRLPRGRELQTQLVQAGSVLTVTQYLAGQLLVAAIAGAGLMAFTNVPATVAVALGALAGLMLPRLQLRRRRQQRQRRFAALLPDTLEYLARSLHAGHTFPAALKQVAQAVPEPMARELRTVVEEMDVGLAPEQALRHFGRRTGTTDLRAFALALLQRPHAERSVTAALREQARDLRRQQAQAQAGTLSASLITAAAALLALLLAPTLPRLFGTFWPGGY